MKYKEIAGKYRCDDDVSHVFTAAEVTLKTWGANNFNIFGQSVVAVDNEGNVMRCNTDKLRADDRVLHCPRCGKAHLFGFDSVD